MSFKWQGDKQLLQAPKSEQGVGVIPHVEDGKPFALLILADGTEVLLNKSDIYKIAGAYAYADRRKKYTS